MQINPETFIQDFRELFMKSPQCGSWTRASENCDYGDITTVSKDCYMCFNSGNCQDAYYCEDSRALTDCVDLAFCEGCELCYECVDCDSCYGSNFCQDCHNSNDIYFSYDLRRCKDCIGCVGLRDKQYFIFNKSYSREDYERIFNDFDFDNDEVIAKIEGELEKLKKKVPRMYAHQLDTTKCTGDYVYHSKNCHMCFDTRHTEDSGYITQANLDMGTKDSWDCGPIPTGMDLCYDIAYAHYLFNCKHLYFCGNLKESQWAVNCMESENLFGCHYMKDKQNGFYILNQKVEEDFYNEMTAKINKMLTEKGIYTIYDLLHKDLSKGKVEISDDQFQRECVLCEGEFELIPTEVEFYKEKDIIFPVYCPSCRADQRINLRNERKMYKRKCDACKNTLITTFPEDSKHIVYCLDCWYKHQG
jgi:hypothetical protein